ncbi:hypothetical protein ACVMAJ_005941 [Bradyrhizobium sp. USDA 4448]
MMTAVTTLADYPRAASSASECLACIGRFDDCWADDRAASSTSPLPLAGKREGSLAIGNPTAATTLSRKRERGRTSGRGAALRRQLS